MRARRIFTTGLVLTLMALGTGGAVAASTQQQAAKDQAEKLTFYSEETSSVTVSRTGEVFEGEEQETSPQPAAGDRFIIVEKLYSDKALKDEVGRNDIACTVTESSGEFPEEEPAPGAVVDFFLRFICEGVIYIYDDGTLTFQGAAEFSADTPEDADVPFITVAITGGTEKYIRAGGQAEIFDVGSDEAGSPVLSRYDIALYDLAAKG